MRRAATGLACVVVLVGGCFGPGGGDGTATTTTAPPRPVDGDIILALVQDIVYEVDGSLRERRPEAPAHLDTAQWLADHVRAPWTVRFVDGGGPEYQALHLPPALDAFRQGCTAAQLDRLEDMTFRNVEFRLDNGHDDAIILAAHWDHNRDTRDGTGRRVPGANDGASGVAVLLAMQDALAALVLPFDVVLLLTDGEDGFRDCHPTAGAALYAAHELDEADHRLILLDMVGDRDARFVRETYSAESDPALLDLLWELAPAHRLAENVLERNARILDDHVPFIAAGVPAVDIIDAGRPSSPSFPPYWETVDDTPERLDATMLADVAAWLLATLDDPRFTATWTSDAAP
jgi:hypothetical protein